MTTDLTRDITFVSREDELPSWATRDALVRFFHETMAPWNDSREDVGAALDYLFSSAEGKGGFLTLLERDGRIGAAVAMLETGMGGCVPSHMLLFVSVDPGSRGQGIGGQIIEAALSRCPGDVKLHVEYDNPAKRLYERLGFTTKYAEMRYGKPPVDEG